MVEAAVEEGLLEVEAEVGEHDEFKEPVKLRLRRSWEEVVEEVPAPPPPAIPDEEEDLEGAGVRLVS